MGKKKKELEEEPKEKIETMDQEVERLRRRNKILTKRVMKLEEENANLSEEVAVLEISLGLKEATSLKDNKYLAPACEHCGGILEEVLKAQGASTYKCLSYECRERRLKRG